MIWMYLYLRSPFENFLTNLDTSMFSPNKASLDDNPNILFAKSSTVSLSSIFNLSNSVINVSSLASLTRLASRCRDLMEFQSLSMRFVLLPGESKFWEQIETKEQLQHFSSFESEPGLIVSHTSWTRRKTFIMIDQTI